tara:strand:+ start:10670 stop:11734 length:1065 start_codon:yes stop_codon:yes gene_type:complete
MSGLRNVTSLPFEKFRHEPGPIIDIRSPKEYSKGHWPGSKNVPLFSDKERETIGIKYKSEGPREAVKEGIKLIIPKLLLLKKSLSDIYQDSLSDSDPSRKITLRIYCWRGGMRSLSVVWLMNKVGLNSIQLKGGYKSYRKWVLRQFEKEWPLYLIGGKTGTGKTKILKLLAEKKFPTIDFEGLANHRGSSYGGLGLLKQPSCEHYENLISESLNNTQRGEKEYIWVEDESPNLGNCRIPNGLIKQMKNAPLLEITKTKKERIKELIEIYSQYPQKELEKATLRIEKRLGPQRTKKALEAISNKNWEKACEEIISYYDKCYEFQLQKVCQIKSVDLSGMNNDVAVNLLINKGYVY